MNLKQEMEGFGFTKEDVERHTRNHNWFICYANLEIWRTRTFDYGNIKTESYNTFSAFARAWHEMLKDNTKTITGWTGCNDGGY